MKVLSVVGARPNFVKIAPLVDYFKNMVIVHTGQHYDYEMSEIFFKGLNIPRPNYNLNVGSNTHAKQTSLIMSQFEDVVIEEKPDIVIVVGDVNSTLACSLVISKMSNIKLAHIESGERSFDRSMPEEINRIVTDHLSDYLFCSTKDAANNLIREGIDESKIFHTGNIALDNLLKYRHEIENCVTQNSYILFTLHRPSNTDYCETLHSILKAVNEISRNFPVLFPIHPRTKSRIDEFGLQDDINNMNIVDPLGYIDFMKILNEAKCVITDSGGIQVEADYYNVPCITLRDTTEHLYTVRNGNNILIGNDISRIKEAMSKFSEKREREENRNDGRTAERIYNIIRRI